MLLSNKLTYCITGLMMLLLLVAAPVMAHEPDGDYDQNHDGLDNSDNTTPLVGAPLLVETGHTHTAQPTVSSITAVDTKGAVTAGGTLVSNVDGTKIVLVNDLAAGNATRVVIALADHDTDDTTPKQLASGSAFQLKVTFDTDVYPETNAGTSAGAAPTITASLGAFTGHSLLAASKPGVDVSTVFSIGTLTRVETKAATTGQNATPAEYSKREFLMPITTSAAITEDQLPISIWVTVNANQVFSLTKIVNGQTIQGRGNAAYTTDGASPFTVDGYMAVDPLPDTAGPDITAFTVAKDGTDLKFTVTFDESLGRSGILPSHLEITGGTLVAGTVASPNPKDTTDSAVTDDKPHTYEILVTPTGDLDETEVEVKIRDGSVADLEGNYYREPATNVKVGKYDTVNPTVTPLATGVVNTDGSVKLSVTFSEKLGSGGNGFANVDIDRTNSNVLLTNTQPAKAAKQPTDGTEVWELTVTPVPVNAAQAIIVIKAGSVKDMKGNPLVQDTIVTWDRRPSEEVKPVVTIALSDSTKTYIDSVDGGMVTATASDSGSGLATGAEIVESEVTVENGSIKAGSFVKGSTATFTVIPNIGAITVKVTVAAGAAMDAAGNGSAKAEETFNVGPIFTIPANTILVITKTAGMTHSYVSDQPRLPVNQQPPTPAPDFTTALWENMPDLEVLFSFDRGGNGGTLNLTEAAGQAELAQTRDGDKNQKNSVRISEVMWASDLYKRGSVDDAEAKEQWIEVSNDTGSAVKVFLFARTGRDSAINVDDVEDRVGNAYDGGIGSAGWVVPGQNGNSYTGVDFVSMHRKWVSGDNRGYVNGMSKGNWFESGNVYLTSAATGPSGVLYNYKGSPGRPDNIALPKPSTRAGVTQVPSSPFIINEVANRDSGNAKYEWIEIKNVTDSEQNLRNYLISMVEKVGDANPTDTVLLELDNKDYKVPAGGVILLLASDPRYDDEHPIAVGYNVDVNVNDQVDGLGITEAEADDPVLFHDVRSKRKPPLQKVTTFKNGGLPDGGDYILILRKPDNYEGHRSGADGGKGVAETSKFGENPIDVDKIVDIAGSHRSLDASNYPKTAPVDLNKTTLWPLVNFNGDMRPHYGDGNLGKRRHNRLEVNRVRYRQHIMTKAKNDHDGATPGNRAGTGTIHKDEGVGHYAFRDADYTGLGYKRTARAAGYNYNHGTPGYDGNSVGNTGVVKATAADAMVTISEIMYSTGPADNPVYPQWIELYNSSLTNAVNLKDWKLRFETLDDNGDPMDSLMVLEFNKSRSVKTILPQQTVLIVAGNARQANSDSPARGDVFNENRVFNVYRDVGKDKFGKNTRLKFFNSKRFHLALLDKDNKVVDAAGNLDGDARTSDKGVWDFPSGVAADDNRTSIIRVYDDGVAREGVSLTESHVMPILGMGEKMNGDADKKWSWIPAVNTNRAFKIDIQSTWYGHQDDYGTPNNRRGMALPVELSHFRPTLEDGKVTVRWTTESELDNAGFNILRSDTRNGEYKQVNAELIEGAGTTGERNTYKWIDQTAKPGVVYYYQIEDVSFAGERQSLATTKLKGLISAKNKLTTTWSELKTSQ